MAPTAVDSLPPPSQRVHPNDIISAPAATTDGLIYFPGIGGSHVLPSKRQLSDIRKRSAAHRHVVRRRM